MSSVEELGIENVDKPFSELQEKQDGIKGHIGSAIIIFEFQGKQHVLLVQRVGGSKPWSWEVPGGKYEKAQDTTIVDGAIRETKEETGWTITRDNVLDIVYRSTFYQSNGTKNDVHYIIVNQKVDMLPKIKLEDSEHCAYGFFTKEQVEGLDTRTQEQFIKNRDEIEQAINSGQKLILAEKKEVVLMAFEAKSKSLGYWGRIGFIGFYITWFTLCFWVGYAIL